MSCAGHSGLAAIGSVRPLCALVRIPAYERSTDGRPAIQRACAADGDGLASGRNDGGGVRLGASSAALSDRAKKTEGRQSTLFERGREGVDQNIRKSRFYTNIDTIHAN